MLTPTSQQQAIIDAVAEGKDMVIQALAGTGKTTTLRMIAEHYPDKKFLYIVFNKSQQLEAQKKMPSNVEPRTCDSLAWKFVNRVYEKYEVDFIDRVKNTSGSRLVSHKQIAEYFSISRYEIQTETKKGEVQEKLLTVAQTVAELKKAIDRFCVSSDDEISIKHFNSAYSYPPEATGHARMMWNDIKDLHGKLKITHTHMAKLWSLKSPDLTVSDKNAHIKYDAILIDEAQDTNPVYGEIYKNQKIQKIYVGDQNQAIYGFRGAEDELQKVDVDIKLPLTESWRFGSDIASIANSFLKKLNAPNKVVGLSEDKGKILSPGSMIEADAVICRTNAGALRAIFERLEAGQPVKIDKNFRESLRSLLNSLAWFYGYLKEKPILHQDLEMYSSREELEGAIEDGDESKKVAEMAELLKTVGLKYLESALEALDNRARKNCVEIITAHRSKGSEWDKVQIYTDFWGYRKDWETEELIPPSPEEFRLAYVGVTRARKELDLGSLDYIVPKPEQLATPYLFD
jgi:hypothetical protein